MNESGIEVWEYCTDTIKIADISRKLTAEDVCPICDGALRIASGIICGGEGHMFRLECTSCSWYTEALPDPEFLFD